MLPLQIFSSRQFSAANAVTFVVYAALGGVFFLLVIMLQVVLGYSAIAAGAAALPVTVILLLLSARSGALAQRIGPRLPLTFGPLLIAGGMLMMSGIGAGDSYVTAVLPGVIVYGLGLALVVAPITATVLAAADARHAGVASGVNNAVARTAQLAAVAALPLIVGLSGNDFQDPVALADGFHAAMIVTAALAVAGGVLAFAFISNDVLDRTTEPDGSNVDRLDKDLSAASTGRRCGRAAARSSRPTARSPRRRSAPPVNRVGRMAKDLQLGLNTGYWAGGPPPNVVAMIAEAEALGYDSMWTSEAYGSDCISPLAWWGSQTEKLRLGTAIMQMSARQPAAAAMAAMTMDHLSGGRFILGIGVSGPQVVEGWYGMPFPKPLARTREYIGILRDIWEREGPVTNDGPHYPLPFDDAERSSGLGKPLKASIHPSARRSRSSWAARARRTSRSAPSSATAGCRCSSPPPTRTSTCPRSRRAGAARGPAAAPDDFEVACMVPMIVGDDVEACADALRPFYALYFGGMGAKGKNFHANVPIRMGYEKEVLEIQDLYLAGKKDEAARADPARADRRDVADRPEGEDPRRPRQVARVGRHPADDPGRRRGAAAHRGRARPRRLTPRHGSPRP